MDNEEEETQKEITQKRKNSDQSMSSSFAGDSSSTRLSSEEEEDLLELRLNSQPCTRPRSDATPRNLTGPELHQLSISQIIPSHAQNPQSNHVQLSNTQSVYQTKPFYPFNNIHGPNRPIFNAPPPPPPPSPPPPPPQPSVVFGPDMRSRDMQIQQTQPETVFPLQNPPPVAPPGGPRPLVRPARARRNSTQTPGQGKSEMVPAPFPWATTRRATIYSLSYLREHNILTISGDVKCKRCEKQYEFEYNLMDKYREVGSYIIHNRSTMHDRAPDFWKDPVLPTCKYCDQENSAKPVMADKKKEINWLFLFLGQMLGCCTLEQLKYFCKHTKNHRTGAKDRVLYLTYLCLCKQLDPTGPFDP